MNLFVFDPDPRLSALWLDDVRKNKIILECAQMLSTAINCLQPNHNLDIYDSFNPKHPCCVWVRSSWANYKWTLDYMKALYNQRGKPHSSYDYIHLFEKFLKRRRKFPETYPTPFANCAANDDVGVSFKHIPDTCLAYRKYISARWELDTINVTWNHGEKPWWYKGEK